MYGSKKVDSSREQKSTSCDEYYRKKSDAYVSTVIEV
jgi:hypothetical protein